MKKILALILAVLTLATNTAFASFSDVSNYKNDTFSEYINWLEEQGVVQGYSDGTFRPEKNITRAEFLKMLYETIGREYGDLGIPFSDVYPDAWYAKYVKEAYSTGIVEGYENGTFRPENPINFAEALKIVMEAFFDVNNLYEDGATYNPCNTIRLDSYSSVSASAWYWKYLHVADEFCILDFDSSANVWKNLGGDPVASTVDFNPSVNITRGDMAALLYIAKAVSDNGNKKYNSISTLPDDVPPPTIKIKGNEDCITKTNDALDLLKEKAKTNYDMVVKYVGIIECADTQSGMSVWEDPPRYQVGKATMDAGTIWYAGTIVHDAYHSKLYNDYLAQNPSSTVPTEIYSGKDAEQQCLDIQYEALVDIGAAQHTLDYIKNEAINTEYWNIDYEDRWW
ncbi:S-layer homology domain-containing protein [Candidatus Gracilibacteria bacterium]|jgi:hypothetical protein|nr:S-layer homology domain-containing protein [Candidatus Gracilibacteria bacterium]